MDKQGYVTEEELKNMSAVQLFDLIFGATQELKRRNVTTKLEEETEPKKLEMPPAELCPIGKLDINHRALNGLKRLGFFTVADLMKTTQAEIFEKSPKFGRNALNGVAEELKKHYNFDFK